MPRNLMRSRSRTFAELVDAARDFIEAYHLLQQLDPESRDGLTALIDSMRTEDLEDDEFESGLATIAQVLYPEAELEAPYEAEPIPEQIVKELDEEEETFANRVSSLMTEKRFTQTQLAEAIGVTQSAVSLMLSRKARPQRRTVRKVAEALGVSEESLWPGHTSDAQSITSSGVESNLREVPSTEWYSADVRTAVVRIRERPWSPDEPGNKDDLQKFEAYGFVGTRASIRIHDQGSAA